MSTQKPLYVLIIEENVHHAELLTEVLDRHFAPVIIHTVDTFTDGMEFLEQSSYDIVLSSGYIGDESILDVARDIVALAQKTPVIVITGRGDERFAARLTRRGVAEYVVKTQESLEHLHEILKKHFRRSKRARGDQTPNPPTSPTKPPTSKELAREIDLLKDEIVSMSAATRAKHKAKALPGKDQLDRIQQKLDHIRRLTSEISNK